MATPFADGLKGLSNGQWLGAPAWQPGVTGTGSPNATPGASNAPPWQADPGDPLLAPILQRQGSIQAQAVAGGTANDRAFAPTDIFSRDEIEMSLHARQHSTQATLESLGRAADLPAILRHRSDRGGQAVMDSCRALALAGAQEHPDQTAKLQQQLIAYLDAAKGKFEGTNPNWDSAAFRQLQKLERALEALLAQIGPQELTRQLQADLAPAMLEMLSRKHPGACATTLLPKLTGCLNPEAFAIQQGNMRRYDNGLAALLREAEKLPYLLDEPAANTPPVETPKTTSAQPPFLAFTGSPYPPFINNFNPVNTFNPVITASPTSTVSPVISTTSEPETPQMVTARTTADQGVQAFETRSRQDDVRDRGVHTDRPETSEVGTDSLEPVVPVSSGNLSVVPRDTRPIINDTNLGRRNSAPELALRLYRGHQDEHADTEVSTNGTARAPRRFRHDVIMPPNAGMMTLVRPGSRGRFTINGSDREDVLRQDVRIAPGAEVINDGHAPIVAGTLRERSAPQNAPFVRVGLQPASIKNLNHRGSSYAPGQILTGSGASSPASTPRMPLSPTTSMAPGGHTLLALGRGTARPQIRASSGTGNGTRDPALVSAAHLARRLHSMGSNARNPLVSSVPPPPGSTHQHATPSQPSSPVSSGTLRRSSRNELSRDDDVGPVASSSSGLAQGTDAWKLIAQQAAGVATRHGLNPTGTSADSNSAGASDPVTMPS